MNVRSVMRVLSGLALAGTVGCAGGGDGTPMTPAPTGGMGGSAPAGVTFEQEELDSISTNLALMPPTPWEDKSNKFGDNEAAARIGKKFYFETRYSSNGKVSCATCHDPKMGFQDNRAATSSGPDPTMYTGRHAPTVINAAHGSGNPLTGCWQFWDGRADSMWAQALGPPENDVEMGGSRTGIYNLIKAHYKAEYELAFGKALPDVTVADGIKGGTPAWDALPQETRDAVNEVYVHFGKGIAAYERKVVSRNSRFDTYLADFKSGKVDSKVLSEEEKLGLKVYVGKGKCISCHRGPNLTDWKFHNIGESQLGMHVPATDPGRAAGLEKAKNGEFSCNSRWSDHPDKSQCAINMATVKERDQGAFKTPGLRDISKTGPYMHTGRLKTLEEVVDHYDQGGGAPGTYVGTLSPDVVKLNLTKEEKTALVKFMKTLDGEPLPADVTEPPALPGI